MTAVALTAPPATACRHARGMKADHLRPNDFARAQAPWRLTRRGRSVLVVALLAIVSVAVVLGAIRATAASTTPPQGWVATVVQPGDTLWSLAAADSGQDPRAVIATIRSVNGLNDSALIPGQRLYLPR